MVFPTPVVDIENIYNIMAHSRPVEEVADHSITYPLKACFFSVGFGFFRACVGY